nr:9304_t:CDS:2 [Entrophospora candida]
MCTIVVEKFRIFISSSNNNEFRLPKSLFSYFLTTCKNLTEIEFQYYQESNLPEPFEVFNELNPETICSPLSKILIDLTRVPSEPILSLIADHIETLEELTIKILYQTTPLPVEILRRLIINNKNLRKVTLYTIEGCRVLSNKDLPYIVTGWWSQGEI